MIGKIITTYQKMQMDMIGKLSSINTSIIDEAPFFDEGYISVQIERLKEDYEDYSRELKISVELNGTSDYELKKRETLKRKMEKTELQIIHMASNSFQALEMCENLIGTKNYKIGIAIKALKAYRDGREEEAVILFKEYFVAKDVSAGYFLINKTYGKLLLKQGKHDEALLHLEYAVQLRVDDIELLFCLQRLYMLLGLDMEKDILDEVIDVLK